MSTRPTLLCVHAHPDDEALFTAGISSHYAEQGFRVVLVTCTDGRLGIDYAGRSGEHPDHDADDTSRRRSEELTRAAALVGFDTCISLGFHDSGMAGWSPALPAEAFVQCDVAATASNLARIIDDVNATVVVTYDENGYYGHPDHIMANRVTRAAVEASRTAQRLFYVVTPQRTVTEFLRRASAENLSMPAWITSALPPIADDAISTTMDVAHFARRKQEAIATHASQTDNQDLVAMDPTLFQLLFGTEYYHYAWRRNPADIACSADLFGGKS